MSATDVDHRVDAVSWLFVPGSRPERFTKASCSGSGAMIIDLEDAVAEHEKASARDHAVSWLAGGASGWVRVNAVSTDIGRSDLDALAGVAGLRGVVVPKAESAADIVAVRMALRAGVGVVALVESARGTQEVNAIAAASDRLAFGSVDFALDIGADEQDEGALLLARSMLVLASRVAGRPAPIDGVTITARDVEATARAARQARALGFGAKLCIHPDQVAAVEKAFEPTDDEVAWANRVMKQSDGQQAGVLSVDGVMVDRPVLDRAESILERARRGADR